MNTTISNNSDNREDNVSKIIFFSSMSLLICVFFSGLFGVLYFKYCGNKHNKNNYNLRYPLINEDINDNII